MSKDQFLKELERSVKVKDGKAYAKTVEKFGLGKIDADFFHETFSGGDPWEIDFWINYRGRKLTVFDVAEMTDLNKIKKALKRKDLDFTGILPLLGSLYDEWSEEKSKKIKKSLS